MGYHDATECYIYIYTDTCCMTWHVLGSVCTSCFTPSYGLPPLELDWACDSKNLSGHLLGLLPGISGPKKLSSYIRV